MSPKTPRLAHRYTTEEFRPYVEALGQLALAWNDLQESLGLLFWTLANPQPLVGASLNYNPVWIWASVRSDRTQREMLKAVINRSRTYWGPPDSIEDLIWLVDEANKLEEIRNNALHSPLFSVNRTGLAAGEPPGIEPATWMYNFRAMNLSERSDILGEFIYCHESSITLADYAHEVNRALTNWSLGQFAWPKKPSLPVRPPKKDLPPQRRPARKK